MQMNSTSSLTILPATDKEAYDIYIHNNQNAHPYAIRVPIDGIKNIGKTPYIQIRIFIFN